MNLLLINGPNLNLLGKREPEIYGYQTLNEIEKKLQKLADARGVALTCFQSNSEAEIIECIHRSMNNIDGIMINAGALTHTSIGLRDALIGVDIPFVELHLSNIYSRERFRHKSFLSDCAIGLVCGFGISSYELAMQGISDYLSADAR